MQKSLMIEQFFLTLQELYNFLTKSTSRFDTLKEKIEELQEGLIMKNLSKTRWIGRAESIRAVWTSYEVKIDTLDAIKDSAVDRDAILTASHLSEKLQSFEFYLSILFMKNIMYKMKIMVLEVQEIERDILSSFDALCHTQDARLEVLKLGLHFILSSTSDYVRKPSFSYTTCIVTKLQCKTKYRIGYKNHSLKIAFVEFLKLFCIPFYQARQITPEKSFSFITCNVKNVVVLYQKEDWVPVPQSKNSFWGHF